MDNTALRNLLKNMIEGEIVAFAGGPERIQSLVSKTLKLNDYAIDEAWWGCSPHYLLRRQKFDYLRSFRNHSLPDIQRLRAKYADQTDIFYEGTLPTRAIVYRDSFDANMDTAHTLENQDPPKIVQIPTRGGNPKINVSTDVERFNVLFVSSESIYSINNIVSNLFRLFITHVNFDEWKYARSKNSDKIDILIDSLTTLSQIQSNSIQHTYKNQEELNYEYNPYILASAIDGARRFSIYHELSHAIVEKNPFKLGIHGRAPMTFNRHYFSDIELEELVTDNVATKSFASQFLNATDKDMEDQFCNVMTDELMGVSMLIFNQYFSNINTSSSCEEFFRPSDFAMGNLNYIYEGKAIPGDKQVLHSILTHPSPEIRLNYVLSRALKSIRESTRTSEHSKNMLYRNIGGARALFTSLRKILLHLMSDEYEISSVDPFRTFFDNFKLNIEVENMHFGLERSRSIFKKTITGDMKHLDNL